MVDLTEKPGWDSSKKLLAKLWLSKLLRTLWFTRGNLRQSMANDIFLLLGSFRRVFGSSSNFRFWVVWPCLFGSILWASIFLIVNFAFNIFKNWNVCVCLRISKSILMTFWSTHFIVSLILILTYIYIKNLQSWFRYALNYEINIIF